MSETYNLRLSKNDPDVSDTNFISWLKGNGHLVSMTNDAVSTVNGIPVENEATPMSSLSAIDAERQQWAQDALFDLLAFYIIELKTGKHNEIA